MSEFLVLLAIHIFFGSLGIACAAGAILTVKGSTLHRFFGRWFFYAMCGIFFTAIPISLLTANRFLFLIAIFSFYFAYTGFRYAKRHTAKIPWYDWAITLVTLLCSLLMIGWGFFQFNFQQVDTLVLLVFGGIGLIFTIND